MQLAIDSTPDIFKLGAYSITEAAALLQLKPAKLRTWFFGRQNSNPVLEPHYDSINGRHYLSFHDLIEARFLSTFRSAHHSMQKLRKLHEAAVTAHDTRHPFCRSELMTDGLEFFEKVYDEYGDSVLLEFGRPQQVMEKIVDPVLVDLRYDRNGEGYVNAWELSAGVLVRPGFRMGQPTVESCGIPTNALYAAYLSNDRNLDRVAWWYGIKKSEVLQAIDYEERKARTAA